MISAKQFWNQVAVIVDRHTASQIEKTLARLRQERTEAYQKRNFRLVAILNQRVSMFEEASYSTALR